MKQFLTLLTLTFSACTNVFSQAGISYVYVRNSTWQEFDVSVNQYGTHTMDPSEWDQLQPNAKAWKEGDSKVFETARTAAAILLNDTVYFDIKLSGDSDTLTIKVRLIGIAGGSAMAFSIEGPGFAEPWQTDGNFHQLSTTLAGKDVIIKYKPDNDDAAQNRHLRFAIHNTPVYEIDEADFQNPDMLNVMAYNIQMLPGGVSGMGQLNDRADHLPANYSPWQDVVINAEAFDLIARGEHLDSTMLDAGFPYRTTVLNDPPGGGLPTNGGVIIYSRWPIENSAEIRYSICGPTSSDCFSRKGMKYACVNKLGKKYHIFGTHMDAGSDPEDSLARHVQISEIKYFIDSLEIPSSEAVVFGGDFNISPLSGDGTFQAFIDTLNPLFPYPIGDDDSNFSDIPGKIIDHVWADSRHLLPLEATNKVITIRSLEDVLWSMSEFSDHRAVLGRFVYPDVGSNNGKYVLCPHDSLLMEISADSLAPYQWKRDGADLPGETSTSYALNGVSESDGGLYQCAVSGYDVTYGDDPDNNILHFFYPNGPQVFHAEPVFTFNVIVDSVLCQVGIDDPEALAVQVYPNPNEGAFVINNPTGTSGFFEIYSATGSLIMNAKLLGGINRVELVQPAGIYFAVIRTGEHFRTEKVIIR